MIFNKSIVVLSLCAEHWHWVTSVSQIFRINFQPGGRRLGRHTLAAQGRHCQISPLDINCQYGRKINKEAAVAVSHQFFDKVASYILTCQSGRRYITCSVFSHHRRVMDRYFDEDFGRSIFAIFCTISFCFRSSHVC